MKRVVKFSRSASDANKVRAYNSREDFVGTYLISDILKVLTKSQKYKFNKMLRDEWDNEVTLIVGEL